MDSERFAFLALHLIPGIGDTLLKQLISYCGSAEEVFKTSHGKLLKIPGIGTVTARAIKHHNSFHDAEKEYRNAEKADTDILFFTDKRFPYRLKAIPDAPTLLYLKGNINLNPSKTIGIVGTRQATPYGREMVAMIMDGLVHHQPLVISGLAYGIDIVAHKLALKYNLPTIGVLGSGIDVIYPSAHREVAKKMMDHGGLITENRLGTKPDAHNFPARNRIIAGMCDALIIVEAAEKGGALITAEIANSYNKDVFAIPGNIGLPFSQGCNKLIKINKANLLMTPRDIEYIMNWDLKGKPTGESSSTPLFDTPGLTPHGARVILTLREKDRPVPIDELSALTEIPLGLLAAVLLELEFSGTISCLPGKQYRLRQK